MDTVIGTSSTKSSACLEYSSASEAFGQAGLGLMNDYPGVTDTGSPRADLRVSL